VGLLTVDVTPLGIVMAADSQRVDIYADRLDLGGFTTRNSIVRMEGTGFSGFVGSIGTEKVGGEPTAAWLARALADIRQKPLSEVCEALGERLTAIWEAGPGLTRLSLFVAGYEEGEPQFWWIANEDVPGPSTVAVPTKFDVVNDLTERYYPQHNLGGETIREVIERNLPSFRRGVMEVANVFDRFTVGVGQTIQDGQRWIPPLHTLERFAAYTRFRFEYTKRVYDPKYGIGVEQSRPVAGNIQVVSVDPLGIARVHYKHVGKSRILA
jgi:hypothetical protein